MKGSLNCCVDCGAFREEKNASRSGRRGRRLKSCHPDEQPGPPGPGCSLGRDGCDSIRISDAQRHLDWIPQRSRQAPCRKSSHPDCGESAIEQVRRRAGERENGPPHLRSPAHLITCSLLPLATVSTPRAGEELRASGPALPLLVPTSAQNSGSQSV